MSRFLAKTAFARLAVFIAGFCVMSIEILASRLIAPVVGNSILIWTNLIGLILVALAIGAWFGGRLTDRYPHLPLIQITFIVAGIWTFLLPGMTTVGFWLVPRIPEGWITPFLSLVFLVPPAALLGAVPPMALKQTLHETADTGRVAGSFSALGTGGSLLGTYLTGYILIAHWSLNQILILLGTLLVACGLFSLKKSPKTNLIVLFCLLTFLPGQALWMAWIKVAGTIIPSHYSALNIQSMRYHQKPARILWMDNTAHAGAPLDHPDQSIFPYEQTLKTLSETLAPNAKTLLAIGGGGFHAPRAWLGTDSTRQTTVIERDPAAIKASQQFFSLTDDPRLTIIEGDGRTSLTKLSKKFDLVMIDAFADRLTIPWHLITKEAFTQLGTHLNPQALIFMNIILRDEPLNPWNQKLVAGIVNATNSIASWHKLIRVNDGAHSGPLINAILIMGQGAPPSDASIAHALGAIQATSSLIFFPIEKNEEPAFTDSFAPVEYLSIQLLH